ncbi:uncharacterized protein LOC131683134 isoform X2 [Topomyia yanbarensis]|nr:uncharacterized protein LOC131683134 isoform X2 [Topomyia yanbarensis]
MMHSLNSYEETRSTANKPNSHDPIEYIQKARVTRIAPPKPAYDPLQFVQIKPCSLTKSAQDLLKKADEVKKAKEDKREEPEEWQCNLDNWKSSRRKRVEHIIDRVVKVKKYESVEHDHNRRKSKTFNEIMEERGSRQLKHLPIYANDDDNDLSDLGLSNSDSTEKNIFAGISNLHEDYLNPSKNTSNADLNEYTYEGAIEDYKSRISRAGNLLSDVESGSDRKESHYTTNRQDNSNLEYLSASNLLKTSLSDVPKIDFLKRKELFEKKQPYSSSENESKRQSTEIISTMSIKDKLSVLYLSQADASETVKQERIVPEVSFTDLKNRFEIFEKDIKNVANDTSNLIKQSLSTSPKVQQQTNHNTTSNEHVEIVKQEDIFAHKLVSESNLYHAFLSQKQATYLDDNDNVDTDREDSGIHTTDVSCSVSQADDQNDDGEQHDEVASNLKSTSILPIHAFSETMRSSRNNSNFGNLQPDDELNDTNILDDALEMAFQAIDNLDGTVDEPCCTNMKEPIYQNVSDVEKDAFHVSKYISNFENESYYQVSKALNPYYEVPKTKPISLYENVDILQLVAISSGSDVLQEDLIKLSIGINNIEPPKEKPPPPPTDNVHEDLKEVIPSNFRESFKHMNSTKRIKNEIQFKRSSFLGVEGTMDSEIIEFSEEPPSKVTSIMQDKKKIEKEFLLRTDLIDNFDAGRDSRLSEDHSRQSSELFNTSSDDTEDPIKPKLGEQIVMHFDEFDDHFVGRCKTSEFYQEGIVDMDRQRLAKDREIKQTLHRNAIPSPVPPTKPFRSHKYTAHHSHKYNLYSDDPKCLPNISNSDYRQLGDNTMSLSDNQITYHPKTCTHINYSKGQTSCGSNSCTAINTTESNSYPFHKHTLGPRSYVECTSQRTTTVRPISRSNDSYNQHWFIQEAEQRRIEEQSNIHHTSVFGQQKMVNRKSLPESVIHTITQRVQNLEIGTDRRWQAEDTNSSLWTDGRFKSNHGYSQTYQHHKEHDEKILSVCGKKKCSHCNNELGQGAAMVIESLGLLYHIECFKCCVCQTRLGDGFKGTDVRVRKYELHCPNCFSSENGVKFSCV